MKRAILSGLTLFVEFQAIILIVRYLCGFPMILVRAFVHNMVIHDVIFGISAFLLELVSICWLFYRQKINNRRDTVQTVLLSLPMPLVIQFFFGLLFNFFYYTTGSGVSVLGMAWWKWTEGSLTTYDQLEAPLYPFIILFSIKSVLIVIISFTGFKLGEKKLEKERRAIVRH